MARSVVVTGGFGILGHTVAEAFAKAGDKVARMVPSRDGGANRGHACVKGRFAYGYVTHRDRVRQPLVRDAMIPVTCKDNRITVTIVHGLSQAHPADVMRGEETQIAGLLAMAQHKPPAQ